MGTMTLLQFRTALVLTLDQRADASVGTANLNQWINHAYWHMTYPTVHPFENLKTTYDITLATNDFDYDLDEATVGYRVLGGRSFHHLAAAAPTYATQRSRLKPRSVQWFDQTTHSNGPPKFYVLGEGEQVLISPVPGTAENGQVLRCRLWMEAAALALDADTTVVPSYFDEVLLLGAQAVAEYRLGYRDRARETLEHYAAMLNDPKPKEEIEGEDWGFESQLISEPIMEVST